MHTACDQRLDVLVAHEESQQLADLEAIVRELGHDVVACGPDPARLVDLSHQHSSDLALVGLDGDSEHALALIEHITDAAACPVITVSDAVDPAFLAATARHGVFASVNRADPDDSRRAITTALARFAAFRNLEGVFGRRELIERAKGILMERHQINENEAFELIHAEARRHGRKAADIAAAVNDSHTLLPATTPDHTGIDPGGEE